MAKGIKRLFKKRANESETIPDDLKRNGSQYHVNGLIVAQRLNDVISMILDGLPSSEITKLAMDKYGIKQGLANNIIVDANKEILSRKQYELEDLLNQHVERYEYIYAELTKLRASTYAMNALQAKEKLIQLHKGGTHMRVVGGGISTIAMVTDRVVYDIDKLTPEKQGRLKELMEKIGAK